MRKAQFILPRSEGDAADGTMVVYYFGKTQGGPADLNITRWKSMMSQSDGKPVPDTAARVGSTQVGDLKVTTLDVSGFYHDPMMGPAAGPPPDQEARMLAAVVETPSGPWFFKAVGPTRTMADQKGAFDGLIQTVRIQPPPLDQPTSP